MKECGTGRYGRTTEGPLRSSTLVLCVAAACTLAIDCERVIAQPSGGSSGVGYIDPAPLMNQVRFRFDAAYDNPTPDWAEFFYPRCGCLPGGDGPVLPEISVDFQDFSVYAEHIFKPNLSGFIEVPVRLLNPEVNPNRRGVSDISAGVRVALYDDQIQYLTFQFRTWIPTGDDRDGLGTGNVTLEPGLLYFRQLAPGTNLEAELRDFIPTGVDGDWVGNVLRYGVGLSHRLVEGENFRISPVVEAVAWSVLDGRVLDPIAVAGEELQSTVVNLKVGARFGFGQQAYPNAGSRSLYVGYGRSLTGQRWYEDIFRAEFRVSY